MLKSTTAVAVFVTAVAAFGIQARPSTVSQVRVIAVDAHSESINDLLPDDFVLYVDQVETPIAGWMKVQDWRGRSVYTLRFKRRGDPSKHPHQIVVQVKRSGVSLRYLATRGY
jgi:hypothetical protein